MADGWILPIAVLVAGIIAGLVTIRFGMRDAAKRQAPRASDLESILDQLRAFDDDDPTAARERYRLELEAAELLRAPTASPAPAALPREPGPRSGVKGFFWGTAATASVAILVLAATRSSNEKAPSAPRPSIDAAAEAQAPPIPEGPGIGGVIALDPSVAGATHTPTIVFLIARPVGEPKGMPIAAKRLDVESFPVSFLLTNADSMMGEALPAEMLLEARVDSDGDVVSRDPNDPAGILDTVSPGAMSVRIVLGAIR